MTNVSIRTKAFQNGVCLWELAQKMGITDSSLSRKMRKEFSPEETEKALQLIDEIVAERRA